MRTRYEELVRRLYQINLYHPAKMGLRNITALHAALGSPMDNVKTVHVAGTNGKGSVSLKMSKALQEAGQKTGLFVSPHISCFRERVQINGLLIPEEDVCRILPHVFSVMEREEIPATYFEVVTAMAFSYFGEKALDIAVIEAGLGGTKDATNIITPVLSIMTSVGLEHTRILGETVEEIAREKSGIIKPGVPVLVGPHCPLNILKEAALRRGSPLFQVTDLVPGAIARDDYDFDDENSRIARAALGLLSEEGPFDEIPEACIAAGVAQRPPCRFEVVQVAAEGAPPGSRLVTVVLDVAHNPQGTQLLFAKLRNTFPGRALRLVVGMSGDKSIEQCLGHMLRHAPADRIHPVQAAHPRAVTVDKLREVIEHLSGVPCQHGVGLHESSSSSSAGGSSSSGEGVGMSGSSSSAGGSSSSGGVNSSSSSGAGSSSSGGVDSSSGSSGSGSDINVNDNNVRKTIAAAVRLAAASPPPLLPVAVPTSMKVSKDFAASAPTAGEVVVVCGSVFIMSDARQQLGFQEPQDSSYIAAVAGAHFRSAQDNLEAALAEGEPLGVPQTSKMVA